MASPRSLSWNSTGVKGLKGLQQKTQLPLRNWSDTQCPSKCCSKPPVLGLVRPHSVSCHWTWEIDRDWIYFGRETIEAKNSLRVLANTKGSQCAAQFYSTSEERTVQPTVVVVVATRSSPQYHNLKGSQKISRVWRFKPFNGKSSSPQRAKQLVGRQAADGRHDHQLIARSPLQTQPTSAVKILRFLSGFFTKKNRTNRTETVSSTDFCDFSVDFYTMAGGAPKRINVKSLWWHSRGTGDANLACSFVQHKVLRSLITAWQHHQQGSWVTAWGPTWISCP